MRPFFRLEKKYNYSCLHINTTMVILMHQPKQVRDKYVESKTRIVTAAPSTNA